MDVLTSSLLAVVMLGSTHYADLGGRQTAIIFYEDERTAHMRLPGGRTLAEEWRFTTDDY